MIKTSIVRQVSVDDVRGIPHLTAIGMMATDIFEHREKLDFYDEQAFIKLINGYAMKCDPSEKSMTYYIDSEPDKKVTFYPAGLDGIRVVYSLNFFDSVTVYWTFDQYAEFANSVDDFSARDSWE